MFSIIMIGFSSCKKCEYYSCDMSDPNVVGSYCVDGTTSESVGSGTCSGHGGVSSERCQRCE